MMALFQQTLGRGVLLVTSYFLRRRSDDEVHFSREVRPSRIKTASRGREECTRKRVSFLFREQAQISSQVWSPQAFPHEQSVCSGRHVSAERGTLSLVALWGLLLDMVCSLQEAKHNA